MSIVVSRIMQKWGLLESEDKKRKKKNEWEESVERAAFSVLEGRGRICSITIPQIGYST